MSIAAHWARVAVPCGSRVTAVTPVMMPSSSAQTMASLAQSLTLAASRQELRPPLTAGSPA